MDTVDAFEFLNFHSNKYSISNDSYSTLEVFFSHADFMLNAKVINKTQCPLAFKMSLAQNKQTDKRRKHISPRYTFQAVVPLWSRLCEDTDH